MLCQRLEPREQRADVASDGFEVVGLDGEVPIGECSRGTRGARTDEPYAPNRRVAFDGFDDLQIEGLLDSALPGASMGYSSSGWWGSSRTRPSSSSSV